MTVTAVTLVARVPELADVLAYSEALDYPRQVVVDTAIGAVA